MAHDLARGVAPDLVRKVQREELVRPTGCLGEAAGQQSRAVGDNHSPLWDVSGKFLIECCFCVRGLGHGLDHEISVRERLIPIGREPEGRIRPLDALLAGVERLRRDVLARDKAICVGSRVRLQGLEGIEIDLAQALYLGPRATDGGLHTEPDGNIEAAVR